MSNDIPEWVKAQNQAWSDAIECQRMADAEGTVAFIGEIIFRGHPTKADRHTNVMTFEVMCDWMVSCNDHFREMLEAGDYDGDEIVVNVYEHNTQNNRPEFPAIVDQ